MVQDKFVARLKPTHRGHLRLPEVEIGLGFHVRRAHHLLRGRVETHSALVWLGSVGKHAGIYVRVLDTLGK